MAESGLQRITGLWKRESRSGTAYLSGTTEAEVPAGSKLFIFRNSHKGDDDRKPDYVLYLADDAEQPPTRRAEPGQRPAAAPPPPDDDIPF